MSTPEPRSAEVELLRDSRELEELLEEWHTVTLPLSAAAVDLPDAPRQHARRLQRPGRHVVQCCAGAASAGRFFGFEAVRDPWSEDIDDEELERELTVVVRRALGADRRQVLDRSRAFRGGVCGVEVLIGDAGNGRNVRAFGALFGEVLYLASVASARGEDLYDDDAERFFESLRIADAVVTEVGPGGLRATPGGRA